MYIYVYTLVAELQVLGGLDDVSGLHADVLA